MHADIKQFLFNLLTETKAIAETENAAPHDYASLREFMLQQELKQECDALLTLLLDDHSDFEMKFKQRCKMRETDDLNTLSLKDIPESITNQLYWKIATTVFKPKTLLEMLDIVLPSLKNYVEIHLERPVNPPREFGQRKAEDILKPVIKTSTDRNSLSKLAPELAVLTHFVLTDRDIFHVGEIADYPLTLHVKSQDTLQQVHPNIAEKLYQHNPEFQVLEQDIITLNNKGTSPKTAIENLIRGLNFGGTQMTGSTYANQSAEEAVKQFLNYINALPESTRTNLRAIRSGNLTIGKIIDEEIAIGSCV